MHISNRHIMYGSLAVVSNYRMTIPGRGGDGDDDDDDNGNTLSIRKEREKEL